MTSHFDSVQHRGLRLLAVLATAIFTLPAQAQLRYSGSDTVEPVVQAAQVSFQRGNPSYKLQTQALGTSSGLRELCSDRAAIVGASRPIKPAEAKECALAGIQYTEVPVALDAVVLVVSTKNTWLKDLTLAEVRTLFDPTSAEKLKSWKQLRASFPDVAMRPAGPGIKHGTFSTFVDSIGLKGLIRSDFKDFNDHAGTGRYVAADPGAIGFMPMGEAQSLEGQVRKVAIDFGAGIVFPGQDEVISGKYDKLSRVVYIYINSALLAKAGPQDVAFAKLLVKDLEKFVRFSNLIPLQALQYQENLKRVVFTQ
jgi:phosphate transport system substrate-binding protein